MHKNPKTKALETAFNPEQFFELEPRIRELANIDVFPIDNVDSTNMNRQHWERLVDTIAKEYKNYDGFVVTTGTNTMAYCSAALSFALANIGKPVVLTGAQIPAESISTDARNNLANAIRVSTMNVSGVFIVFGSRIMLGCRAKKVSESELDAFKSFNQKDFGEIGIGITFNVTTQKRHSKQLRAKNGFEDNIVCLTLIPGLTSKVITDLLDNGIAGIILRAYGSGDIPYDLLDALTLAQKKHVPVIVTTQCPGGATIMGLNDVGLKALETGVIQAFDMCMEAISTKLMWLLKQRTPYKKMKKMMEKNLVGEVNSARAWFIMNPELEG